MNSGNAQSHPHLFAAFVELGEDLLAAAKLLHSILVTPSPSRMDEHLKHIRSLEEASNATIRDVVRDLDSEDGSGVLSAIQVTLLLRYLDEAMDAVEEATAFVHIYTVEQRTDQAVKLASFLVRTTDELLRCITGLRDREDISARVRSVAGIEDEADELYRAALGHLMIFGSEPFQAIRWKDIYDRLEKAINSCEEAAQFLGGLGDQQPGERAKPSGEG